MDSLTIASQALEAATRAGADAADAYARTSTNLSIEVRNAEVETVKRATTLGVALRVSVGGSTALVHTTDASPAGLKRLASQVVQIARALPQPKEPTLFAKPQDVERLAHPDPSIVDEPYEKKTARLILAEKAMLAVKGVTNSGGASCSEIQGEIALVNSNGVRLSTPFCHIEMAAEAIAERDGESYPGGRYCEASARRYLVDPETFGHEAGERAVSLLGARPVPTTRAPVIFTPHTGWTVMVCLSQPLRGNFVVQERSYFSDQRGQKVASDLVNIRDNALLVRGSARRAFDGEGTPSRNLLLIGNGVLRNYLTDLASASKLGVQSGGNAVRRSYDSDPEIRGSNYYMEAGAHDPLRIVKETKRGLLLHTLSGWWVGMSPISDTFSSAAMGFWIEDGEIVHAVKGVSIGGAMREMLQSIDRVGTDLEFNGSTSTPTFRVAEMAISGT